MHGVGTAYSVKNCVSRFSLLIRFLHVNVNEGIMIKIYYMMVKTAMFNNVEFDDL